MKEFNTLYLKELKDGLSSPTFYILLGVFNLVMGWIFFNYIVVSKSVSPENFSSIVLNPVFGNMNFILMFMTPIFTMHSFAGEKNEQTLDLLFFSHLSDSQIYWAKYFSQISLMGIMISFTFLFPLILTFSGFMDWGIVFTSYLGIIISISAYISVGLFASSLTDSPMFSAMISFFILFLFVLIVLVGASSQNYLIAQIVSYMSLPYHFDSFVKGAIKSYSIIYFLSFIYLFSYMTKIKLTSRKW